MTRCFQILTATAALLAAVPAWSERATIALVNATGSDIASLEARKSGTGGWGSLPYSARAGASGAATFDTEDCAWDLKVTLQSGAALTYSNVNLCEARLVTLRQRNGTVWVDYD